MILLPIAAGDMIIRPYDPRRPKKGSGGRGILLVAGLLAFVWVVSHCSHSLNSDESPNTIIATVTASAVPPERTAAPATTDNPTPTAPQAGTDAGTDYGTTHGAELCSALAENPTFDGIEALPTPTLGDSIEKYDLGPGGMGEAVGTAIRDTCPQYVPLATAFGRMGNTMAV
jgi:hypothetical protein